MAEPGHPAIPFRIDTATINGETGVGTLATVPQDSLSEVRQCTRVILRTLRGRRIEDPQLGVTDPRWEAGVNTDEIADALDRDEDRADWTVTADPITGSTIGVHVLGVL